MRQNDPCPRKPGGIERDRFSVPMCRRAWGDLVLLLQGGQGQAVSFVTQTRVREAHLPALSSGEDQAMF